MARYLNMAPKRIAIIGPGGAGKSTLARQIGEKTGLPVVHLDAVYWHKGWQETPKDVWEQTVREIVRQPEWITDGNYGGTMELRLEAADTILFLDLPPLLCVWRVVHRWRKYRQQSRQDMAPGCPEKVDFAFVKWIWNYRRDRRPDILARMNKYAEGRLLVHLQTPAQVRRFLQTLTP
jgi:adenylate kinase family enzyme